MSLFKKTGAFLFASRFVLSTAAGNASAAGRAPNVILIMADDLGYECIGAYGGSSYATPNIDRLAETGIRFENAHAQPICTPSRVQIMTGKYNVRNYDKFANLDPGETTFANLFRDAGYKTCMVGKWQLGGGLDRPGHFGFDSYCLWKLVPNANNSRYPNPGFAVDGRFISYNNGEYGPDILSDYAANFIEANQQHPFLLYYSMVLVHNPFEPTPQSSQWNPASPGLDNIKDADFNDVTHFPDMVSYMDKIVGKLIAKLDELGLRENTVVVFTGDNGTTRSIISEVNGRQVRGGKGLPTDAGTHVPLIANGPGLIPPGQVSADLIDFSDILPTLCDISGVSIPEALKGTIDGRSFFPQMKRQEGNPREWIYSWYQRRTDSNEIWESVRNLRYKLYMSGSFYDLENDILELSPLNPDSLTDEQSEIRSRFKQVLEHYDSLRPEGLRVPDKKFGFHAHQLGGKQR